MAHRLAAALELARRGVASRLADGAVPGLLGALLAGEAVPGTRVAAAPGPAPPPPGT
jgi:isopentenyl phosphate kinase